MDDEHKLIADEALRQEMRALAEEDWIQEKADDSFSNPYNVVLSAILPDDPREDVVMERNAVSLHGIDPELHERIMGIAGDGVYAREVMVELIEQAKTERDFGWEDDTTETK